MTAGTNKLIAYVERFNAIRSETAPISVPDDRAAKWLAERIPLLDCPDAEIEEIYYFRWWTFRKHQKQTPQGRVVTEFLPDVPWAGKYNAIACAAGHHLYEGRWLRDARALFDYVDFWYTGGGDLHGYSNWVPDGLLQLCLATGEWDRASALLPALMADTERWEREQRHPSGLMWSVDDRDGSEYSISGSGLRTTLNCYTAANLRAVSSIAAIAGDAALSDQYRGKAEALRRLLLQRLWDPKADFFRCVPLAGPAMPVETWDFERMDPMRVARELWGYLPWYFNLAEPEHAGAWRALLDSVTFEGAYGPATADRRHPQFGLFYTGEELTQWQERRGAEPYSAGPLGHECLWNGPSWPFATSQALTALSNRLAAEQNPPCALQELYLKLLKRYAHSQHRTLDDGTVIPWIDENLHPDTGDWISRTRLSAWSGGAWDAGKGGPERGRDYNHSTYCDLIVSGLFGIRPDERGFSVAPLLPAEWDRARLEGVPVRGHLVTVLYDRDGTHYGRGAGFKVLVDGIVKLSLEKPGRGRVEV